MRNEDFIFNGVSASSMGIRLQAPMAFSAATASYDSETIPGRNGTLLRFNQRFENITGTASCFALTHGVERYIRNTGNWLFGSFGYSRLETTEEPEIFRMAAPKSAPNTEIRMRLLAPFDLEFDCMPQCYLKSGETPVTVESGKKIYNPGLESKPLLQVTGNGTLSIGGQTITIKGTSGEITIDCDVQDAWQGISNRNGNIEVENHVWPTLPPGETEIRYTGLTSVKITPRWWRL